ncbi:MAG: [FeFe] hydrogenase H-cluster radical SAM maturase HydE [Bacteroidales bacterium]|nr:[FeFe] hydrogenase H-cluster radical SAM maturase HydE [Bacteroidales bacterium]
MSIDEIKYLLLLENKNDIKLLYDKASDLRNKTIGNKVYLRGLIEYSDRCSKNCYYCGIRAGNANIKRYTMTDEEVVNCAKYALENKYKSIVLQSGERSDKEFTNHISSLIKKIHAATGNELRITLSCGEQSMEVYKEWFDLNVKRYLLRIEASNPELYKKLHPADHNYTKRLEAINSLVKTGFQAGTGVMIGLPFQTIDDLANDLIFIRDSGAVMVGMGPYIEHSETPLYQYRNELFSPQKRMELSLKMIAVLRILNPKLNIASTTALQTLDPHGRELGIKAGANVIMPNITPEIYKQEYNLYQGKPSIEQEPDICKTEIEKEISEAGCIVAWDEWGDSKMYKT